MARSDLPVSLTTRRHWAPTVALALLAASAVRAQSLGFAVEMKHPSYVVGEPVFAAVTIENHGFRPVNITDFGPFKDNRLFFEISRTPQVYLKQRRDGKIITDLELEKDNGTTCGINLSEWYDLLSPGAYRIRAVLIVGNERYESPMTSFDIVPGIELASVTQYLQGKPPLERKLLLVYWSRDGKDVAFLRSWDANGRIYGTLEIGPLIRNRKPVLQRVNETTYYVHRQVTSDALQRAEIISDASGVSIKEQLLAVDSAVPISDALRDAASNVREEREKKDKKEE